MKKKLGDFTLNEIIRECNKRSQCRHCPFADQYGRCPLKSFYCYDFKCLSHVIDTEVKK